ncbi:squalene/phytoene synthase family protein [Microvirga pudoricolor]|uniref:squalene/phytoene synthase family protein n=1 Tax=Microvirga pudoricolor TaxID=2778729 RepID=UPI00194F4B41|nr:squalene/phytoene synthase family protein [Microvirga pudoricolor]MBM6593476.1 squalene/phytoene synthase family protein [Microvirga pudoricolor]
MGRTVTTGKGPRDENFPVASLLLAPERRAAVLAFYGFVREADDIADAPDLSGPDKIARLDALEAALLAGDPAHPGAARLHAAHRRHGAGIDEARTLLDAFRQDAVKRRYADWGELAAYCALSANPVGRFLLRLHGEGDTALAPADALCTALQILNHLQDAPDDRAALDRVYCPVGWMEQAGGEEAFFSPGNAARRRAVLDSVLDRVDALVEAASALPERLRDRRLRAQSLATLALARALSRRLRLHDPVLRRVQVSKADVLRAFGAGLRGLRPVESRDAAITAAAVRRSGSSFRLGMQSLTDERRRAIHAVYAFCRAVDDIADGAAPVAEKLAFLAAWRREVDHLDASQTPVGRELRRAADRFGLPLGECHALLDGMETDSGESVRLADDAALDLYGRRVAGSVGALSIRIFGQPEAHDFALGLGRTLQLVNILRDVDEDAARDRVYVPLERLAQAGLRDAPARALVADPRFARVCRDLAGQARAGFATADAALKAFDRSALKPAILMMESYRRLLDRLEARGWGTRHGKLRLTAGDRLQLLTLAVTFPMRTA